MKRMRFRAFWAFLTVAAVVFIFCRSLKSPAVSTGESESVRSLLVMIFGEDTFLGRFLSRYVRKIAHFTEFGVLGALTEGILYGAHTKKRDLIQYAFGFAVACADETIQRFTNRGPSFFDVLIDFAGFCTLALLARLAVFLFARRKNKKEFPGEKKNV